MRKYNINANTIRVIENLYEKAQSVAAQETGSELQTRVSPLFNIFLERTICEALDDHKGSVSIGGQLITIFRFANDIVVNAEEEEADILVDRLDTTTASYEMEIGRDKTKVIQTTQMASKERSK